MKMTRILPQRVLNEQVILVMMKKKNFFKLNLTLLTFPLTLQTDYFYTLPTLSWCSMQKRYDILLKLIIMAHTTDIK